MIESPDYVDPVHGIPVFSLYGTVRRPTAAMMDRFDVLLVDLQDVGCRIYTFITTLRYVLEAAAAHGKSVWVLDRPNPVGRPVEGLTLRPGWESFVGAGPCRCATGSRWASWRAGSSRTLRLNVDCEVVPMEDWMPAGRTGLRLAAGRAHVGQPESQRAESVDGALLSRHGHARRHDVVGRARHDPAAGAVRCAGPGHPGAAERMQQLAPQWLRGCRLRPCWFEPTFHKHVGQLCAGVQIHVAEDGDYEHEHFSPGG